MDRVDRGEGIKLVRGCAIEDGEAHALARLHPAEAEVEERAVVVGPLVGEVARVAEVARTCERIRRREAVVAVEQKFGRVPALDGHVLAGSSRFDVPVHDAAVAHFVQLHGPRCS